MASDLTINAEQVGDMRYSFSVSRPVHSAAGAERFTSPEEAAGTPVAEAVFAVPGICEVELAGNVVTVVKDPSSEWCDLEEPVRYAITAAVEQAGGGEEVAGVANALGDDEMFHVVARIFDAEINPSVARHGGRVELIDVQDATVVLRMQGGCQGCGMANVTLRQGIEASLRRTVPGFRGLQDVTDHSAGTDPYFSAEKK